MLIEFNKFYYELLLEQKELVSEINFMRNYCLYKGKFICNNYKDNINKSYVFSNEEFQNNKIEYTAINTSIYTKNSLIYNFFNGILSKKDESSNTFLGTLDINNHIIIEESQNPTFTNSIMYLKPNDIINIQDSQIIIDNHFKYYLDLANNYMEVLKY